MGPIVVRKSRLLLGAFLLWMPLAMLACGGGSETGAGGTGGGVWHEDPALPPPTTTGTDAATISQSPPYGTQFTEHRYDSGALVNDGDAPREVGPVVLSEPGAASLRVIFEEVRLGEGSLLDVRCPASGEVQTFSAGEMERWGNTTGHFPGDTLEVWVLVAPHASASFKVFGLFEGVVPPPLFESQCGGTDDRVASTDPRTGRLNGGCTMWLEGSNNCALSAGHCFSGFANPQTFPHVIEFNVPLSTAGGALNPSALRDQYPITAGTLNFVDNPANSFDAPDDWAVARLGLNFLGETAVSRQGAGFLADTDGSVGGAGQPVAGDPITITGYGTDTGTANQTNQTHTGPYVSTAGGVVRYQTDTEGGNSGSPVFSDEDGEVIGIHTNAGCGTDGGGNPTGSNAGTDITHAPLVTAYDNVCAKEAASITGPGDQTLQCNDGAGGANVTLTWNISDPDAELVFVEFRVDGTLQGTDTVAGTGPADFTFTFPLGGPYIVVATATNATGTQSSNTILVTVIDTIPPVIACPANIVFECDGINVVTYPDPVFSDTCSVPTLVCVPPSGSVFPVGVTPVTCTATDASGNSASCIFTVTVADTTPPDLTINVARTLLWLPLNGLADIGLTATATDACGAVTTTVTVFSDEDHGAAPLAPDAVITGIAPNQRISLRAQRDPIVNNGRWYIVVVDAIDAAGNWRRDHRVVVVPYNLTTSQILAIRALANAEVAGIPSPAFGLAPYVGPSILGGFVLLATPFN